MSHLDPTDISSFRVVSATVRPRAGECLPTSFCYELRSFVKGLDLVYSVSPDFAFFSGWVQGKSLEEFLDEINKMREGSASRFEILTTLPAVKEEYTEDFDNTTILRCYGDPDLAGQVIKSLAKLKPRRTLVKMGKLRDSLRSALDCWEKENAAILVETCDVVVPTTRNTPHRKNNLQAFDFQLTEEDLGKIDSRFDKGKT